MFKPSRAISKIGRGFTLVEIMIVVVIMSVLAAVAIPAYMKYVRRAQSASAIAGVQGIKAREEAYFAEFAVYATATWNPAAIPGTAKAAWDSAAQDWLDLGFQTNGPTYYRFQVQSSAATIPIPAAPAGFCFVAGVPWYLVTSEGNLNGDAIIARFQAPSCTDALIKTNPND